MDKFFARLGRINAVLIFFALLWFFAYWGWQVLFPYSYDDYSYGEGMPDQPLVTGEEYQIEGGKVVVYQAGEANDLSDTDPAANISLVNPRAGAERLLLHADDPRKLRLWDVVHHGGDEDAVAIGYLARVATDAQWEGERADLIVGRFSDLRQVEVLSDVEAIDSPQVRGDGQLAMIAWLGEQSAEIVLFDFADMRIRERRSIALPAVTRGDLSLAPGRGESLETDAAAREAAPVNVFAF